MAEEENLDGEPGNKADAIDDAAATASNTATADTDDAADTGAADQGVGQTVKLGAAAPAENMNGEMHNHDLVMQIPVQIEVLLGTATMSVAKLMKLSQGSVIPLDHRVGEPISIVVNGQTIARGEVVLLGDDSSKFGVELTQLTDQSARRASAASD